MKLLQFTCQNDPPSTQLKQLLVDQFNSWSRLRWLTTDSGYSTDGFNMSVWKEHTVNIGLWWLNYDNVYNNLGDDGRAIADQMFGDLEFQGVLKASPLVDGVPETQIQIIDVSDLVASGYELPKENTI
jgi:hypothetical protein